VQGVNLAHIQTDHVSWQMGQPVPSSLDPSLHGSGGLEALRSQLSVSRWQMGLQTSAIGLSVIALLALMLRQFGSPPVPVRHAVGPWP
jgi:hypothetical protein